MYVGIIYHPYPWESAMGLIPSQVVFNDFHPRQLDLPRINVRVGPTVCSWCSLKQLLGNFCSPIFIHSLRDFPLPEENPRWDRYYWYIPANQPPRGPVLISPVSQQCQETFFMDQGSKSIGFHHFHLSVMILSPLLLSGQRLKKTHGADG